jgi:hypothetical protein
VGFSSHWRIGCCWVNSISLHQNLCLVLLVCDLLLILCIWSLFYYSRCWFKPFRSQQKITHLQCFFTSDNFCTSFSAFQNPRIKRIYRVFSSYLIFRDGVHMYVCMYVPSFVGLLLLLLLLYLKTREQFYLAVMMKIFFQGIFCTIGFKKWEVSSKLWKQT